MFPDLVGYGIGGISYQAMDLLHAGSHKGLDKHLCNFHNAICLYTHCFK